MWGWVPLIYVPSLSCSFFKVKAKLSLPSQGGLRVLGIPSPDISGAWLWTFPMSISLCLLKAGGGPLTWVGWGAQLPGLIGSNERSQSWHVTKKHYFFPLNIKMGLSQPGLNDSMSFTLAVQVNKTSPDTGQSLHTLTIKYDSTKFCIPCCPSPQRAMGPLAQWPIPHLLQSNNELANKAKEVDYSGSWYHL